MLKAITSGIMFHIRGHIGFMDGMRIITSSGLNRITSMTTQNGKERRRKRRIKLLFATRMQSVNYIEKQSA
jgi:hypothetical protein